MDNVIIPTNHIAQIFSMNIGQEVKIPDGTTYKIHGVFEDVKLDKVNWWFSFSCVSDMSLLLKYGQILKRPLSSITNEQSIIVSKLYGLTTNNTKELIKNGKELVLEHYCPSIVIDYLRSLGYATSITLLDETKNPITYTVEQLFESGIYKLIE